MAIIVEDGSIVTNANSFIDIDYLEAYAEARGFLLPTTDAIKEQYLLIAMDYLTQYRSQFKGSKVEEDQPLLWPRKEVYIDNVLFSQTSIPQELKLAQAHLVVEQQKRVPLFPKPVTSTTEGLVIEKTVGPLTKKFAGNASQLNTLANPSKPIKIAAVEMFLAPLIGSCGQSLVTYRV